MKIRVFLCARDNQSAGGCVPYARELQVCSNGVYLLIILCCTDICDLAHLLQDGQDIEEHLLECGSLKLHIQNDNVVAMVKVPDETSSTSQECSSESSLSLCAIREARPSATGGDGVCS